MEYWCKESHIEVRDRYPCRSRHLTTGQNAVHVKHLWESPPRYGFPPWQESGEMMAASSRYVGSLYAADWPATVETRNRPKAANLIELSILDTNRVEFQNTRCDNEMWSLADASFWEHNRWFIHIAIPLRTSSEKPHHTTFFQRVLHHGNL